MWRSAHDWCFGGTGGFMDADALAHNPVAVELQQLLSLPRIEGTGVVR
jgi:hypothetical protein